MKVLKCRVMPFIGKNNRDKTSIYLSFGTAGGLKIKEGSSIDVELGLKKIRAEVKINSDSAVFDGLLGLTVDIFEYLLLPKNVSVGVISSGDSIKLGPVIGVLTEKKLIEAFMKGKNTREEFDHYADAGDETGALVYIFNLYDMDLESKTVKACMRKKDENGMPTWQKLEVPMPDAIHNRIVFSEMSSVNEEMKSIERLVDGIDIINRITSVDKWKVARMLDKYAEAKRYLPQSKLFRSGATIEAMASKFPLLYLKPIRRSLGLGIIRLEKKERDNYVAYYRDHGENYITEGNIESILSSLREFMGQRTYIVQQGISLATYKSNYFDLRVTMQKDAIGKWSLSSWGARVGATGNVVTNIAAGGIGIPIEKVLKDTFNERAEGIMTEIMKGALIICEAVDNELKATADLGLDIGISVEGRPYLIEINFRDYRLTDEEIQDVESWKLTFKKPIYYLKYLYDKRMTDIDNPQS